MARAQHDLALRLEIEELYTEYAHVLDDGELEQWPDFFIEDCLYQIVSRENRERALPLALMRCESKAMLTDRVVTIRQTQMFAPRALRHLVSSLRIAPATANGVDVQVLATVIHTFFYDADPKYKDVGRTQANLIDCGVWDDPDAGPGVADADPIRKMLPIESPRILAPPDGFRPALTADGRPESTKMTHKRP